MSTISLCVVTRDDAPQLSRCIQSAQPYVDEVVILDSGQLNGAGDWAVREGARLIPYQWSGDAAEARTLVARAASSEWVLLLEPSEQLASGAGEAIREAINLGGLDCGYVAVSEDSKATSTDAMASVPRLLRRTIDLRWDGDDVESVSGWITMRARRVKTVDATIIREAENAMTDTPQEESVVTEEVATEEISVREEVATGDTTIPQLEKSPDVDSIHAALIPDADLATVGIEALIAQAWDRYHDDDLEGTRKAITAVWSRIDGDSPHALQVVTLRTHVQLLEGDLKGALETVGQGWTWGIEHPNLYMLQGVSAESAAAQAASAEKKRQLLEMSADSFTKCFEDFGELSNSDFLPGVTSWAAYTRLGSVRLAQGQITEAAEAFDAALAADPEHAEATLGKYEVLLEDGQGESIMDGLMVFMEADIADSWMLAAAVCEQLGRVEDALLFVKRANDLAQDGMIVAKHRMARMQDQISMAGVYVGRPVAGPGPWGALGAILDHSLLPGHAEVLPVDEAMIVRVVTHFIAAGWSDMIEVMLEPRAEQLAPGIGDAVRRALQAHGAEVIDDFEPEPVFMGGAWDSGIDTLQFMLDAHEQLKAGPEVKLVPILCSLRHEWWQDMGPDLQAAGVSEDDLNAALKAFIQQLTGGMKSDDPRLVESTPHSLLHMGHLGRIFPRARFVHVIRDGRSVTSSLVKRDWMDPSTGEKVWCCQNVQSAAKYWSHVVQAIRQQAALVPGRYIEVRYEDLMAEPELIIRQIIAFLGEPWDPRVLSAELPVRDIPETLTGVDHATVIREAGPALVDFGYTGTATQSEAVTTVTQSAGDPAQLGK